MSSNVELLEQSFALIRPRADEFAASFYQNLFTDYPQARPLFAQTDMEKQKSHLASTLALVVDNLRKPDELNAALKNLGARHVDFGTVRQHYPMVGAALLKTLASSLGDAWTAPVEQAWTAAYGTIAETMLQGAAETTPQAPAVSSSTTP